MNILLVQPYSNSAVVIPPVGLGYLATAVRNSNCENSVEILDCLKEGINTSSKFAGWLSCRQKFDLVGFAFFTRHFKVIKEFAGTVKALCPNAKVVVGGPHPSALPRETLVEIPEIDFAFVGEAELGFPRLVECIKKGSGFGSVPSLVWRKGKQIVANSRQHFENLDDCGLPAWDLLKPESYPQSPHGSFLRQPPSAPITVTRGCPYRCTFCAAHTVSGRRIRRRSLDNVFAEINLLVKGHGIREIHIEDDNFTFDRGYVVEFCRRLIRENLGITWTCPNGVRLDKLDRELLLLMKESGLYSITIGIESGSDRVLSLTKKNLTIGQIREKVNLISSVGLDAVGFTILGFPGETLDEMRQTVDFASSLPLVGTNFGFFQPLPGSEIYGELKAAGKIGNLDWDSFFTDYPTYVPDGVSARQLVSLRRWGLLRFYLRPRVALKVLFGLRSFGHFKHLAKRLLAVANT